MYRVENTTENCFIGFFKKLFLNGLMHLAADDARRRESDSTGDIGAAQSYKC